MKQVLQYLWIEKYGCIEKQDFNFSNRVNIKFDYEKKNLSIEENKNFCENFFGKSIEVSCIVGQNGVGKTTLLRALKEICSLINNINIFEYSFIAIFFDGLNYKGCYTFDELKYDTSKLTLYPIKYQKQSSTQPFEEYKNADYLYYSEQLVQSQYETPFDDNELSESHLLYRTRSINDFFIKEFEKQMNLMIDYGEQLERFKIRYSPYIRASLPNYDMVWQDFIDKIEKNKNVATNDISQYESIYYSFLPRSNFRGEIDYFKDALAKTMFLNIIINFMNSDIKWDDLLLNDLISEMKDCSKKFAWDNFKLFLSRKEKLNKKGIYYVGDYTQFIDYIDKECEFSGCENAFVNFKAVNVFLIPTRVDCDVKTDFKSTIQEFYKYYQEAAVFHSFINFSWGLSSGEKSLLNIFSRLYSSNCRKESKNEVAVFLLDEIDVTLHPEWQRTIINELIKFIGYAFKDKYVQVIMTTHSPIMLSDIPKQNVLFLKKEDDGIKECDGCDTFASNIFQLFREGFFIGDTGIGVYAEKKLKEIVDHIHDKDIEDNELKKLIDSVGDTFLRKKLNEEYLIYHSHKNDTEEKQIARIAALENRLSDTNSKHRDDLLELQKILNQNNDSDKYPKGKNEEKSEKNLEETQAIIKKLNSYISNLLAGESENDKNKE